MIKLQNELTSINSGIEFKNYECTAKEISLINIIEQLQTDILDL